MTITETLERAVSVLASRTDDISRAQANVLDAALATIWDVEHDQSAVYDDGRHMSGERMLRVTQLGRAAVSLAEIIVDTEGAE